MSFDPEALQVLGGGPRRPRPPATLAFLLRIGVAAGVGSAVCDLILWLLAGAFQWDIQPSGGDRVQALSVVIVCLLVAVLAALAAYVAARVTRRPAIWVGLFGVVLLLASINGLPAALMAMHLVAGAWIIGWLCAAVRGGSHLRSSAASPDSRLTG